MYNFELYETNAGHNENSLQCNDALFSFNYQLEYPSSIPRHGRGRCWHDTQSLGVVNY